MRAVIVAVIAVTLSFSLAACGGSDPKASPEYKALSSKLADTQSQLAETQEQVGTLPQDQASLKAAQEKLASDQTELAAEQADVASREKAVAKTEKTIAANTIPGDGTYMVGDDMNPGSYKSTDNDECYWQLSSDANGNDIIANNNVNGQAIVSARAGEYFQSQDCSDWHKIG